MMKTMIIGAGIAGLSCAKTLQDHGHEVDIYEKSRGPSGRMSTRRHHDDQWDHGAQYFTASNKLFKTELQRWLHAGVATRWSVQPAIIGNSENLHSNKTTIRYVGYPSMNSPAKWLAKNLNLRTEHTVSSVLNSGDKWFVTTQEHGAIDVAYDAVILAVPAPQATPFLTQLNHAFTDQVRDVRMTGSWALMLKFDSIQDMTWNAAFINEGPLRWIARDNSKPGRPADADYWVLQSTAAWSEAHIESSPDEVKELLLRAFEALGGKRPTECIVHRWRFADTQHTLNKQFLCDDTNRLGLCGDWINHGKVEGAWLSGHHLGNHLHQLSESDH